MLVLEDRVILRQDPLYLPKVTSHFHRSQEIVLPSFCDNPKNKERHSHLLDVRQCLLTYLERVGEFRKSNHLLVLFSGQKKGGQASSKTVARWIRQAIALAYEKSGSPVQVHLRAHSTRLLAASWAEKVGASMEKICRAATWTSQNTFLGRYRVELLSPQYLAFDRKVLQAVKPDLFALRFRCAVLEDDWRKIPVTLTANGFCGKFSRMAGLLPTPGCWLILKECPLCTSSYDTFS